jgi:hypothetical protein|tara:strand:+ start:149 stop:631 length:483 start_codon:yes stop_codon:yes gene_type:complete
MKDNYRKEQTEKFAIDGIKIVVLIIALISVFASLVSCSAEDDILLLEEPILEIDGRLPIDDNGYYHLELNQDTNQTIHTVSGTVGNTLNIQEPMKVEWESNLEWVYQDMLVDVTNCCSYVMDGTVMNVIAPIRTMVGDTLILTGIIREHLISDSIMIVLD